MLILVGVNHTSAPIAFRERVAFVEDLGPGLDALVEREGIEEAIIVSTCNRVEFVARTDLDAERGLQELREFLKERRKVTAKDLARYSYDYRDREVIRHLLQVATGLDSMILGEPQILGQVRQAYKFAHDRGTTGPVLERLMQHCLGSAKRLRTETGISRHATSIAKAAVSLAKRVFGNLERRRVLLLGAGKMGQLVARYLRSCGVAQLAVASRTYNNAVASAAGVGGTAVHWDQGLEELAEFDIVISCTGAPQQVLNKAQVARALRQRRREPLFVIDIAVPRDVAEDVNDLDGVYLFDIDALHGVVDANMKWRRRAAVRAQEKIEDAIESFERWRRSQEVVPVIVAMRRGLMAMGRREIARQRRKLGPLSEEQQRALDEFGRALVQKILHRPIRHLNRAVARNDVGDLVSLYREIFDLSEGPPEGADDEARGGPERLIRGGDG